ncbi:MAG: spore cortex-lytic enzyme [Clostridia bacterium]|nr:spore cortex-lytic enzyme [Clostridia bacterium]
MPKADCQSVQRHEGGLFFMKNKKLAIALSALIVALGIGAATAFVTTSGFAADVPAICRQGNTGSEVKTVQQKLKNWGYYKGAVDGIFGPKTTEAVKYFQRKNGLTADGIVGPKTLAALGISSGSTGASGYSNSDVYLLARLIHSEARGESYTGQVAVGAVVLNRVKSSSFPNTISGVVYQSNAFTAVSDGQINLAPDETAIRAAKDAMNGWDPSCGSLYYYNPKIATSKWILTRKVVVTIGNHIFAV